MTLRVFLLFSTIFGFIYNTIKIILAFCNPYFYFYHLRIKNKNINNKHYFKGNNYCIYVVFLNNSKRLDDFQILTLQNLQKLKVNTLLIVNANRLNKIDKSVFDYSNHTLIRKNIGRDIGAYKDGLKYLSTNIKLNNIKKLFFYNDSLFVRKKDYLKFLNQFFDLNYDFIAPFQTFEIEHHFQSFAFSVSGQILNHRKYLSFWRRIYQFSHRKYAINKGEKKNTRIIKKLTTNYKILFSTLNIDISLQSQKKIDIFLKLLPSSIRDANKIEFQNIFKNNALSYNANYSSNKFIKSYILFEISSILEKISNTISMRNQIHYLAPLITNCPILKKDIFYRQVYFTFDESLHVLNHFYQKEADLLKFAKQILIKNSYAGSGAGILKRLLIAKGYI